MKIHSFQIAGQPQSRVIDGNDMRENGFCCVGWIRTEDLQDVTLESIIEDVYLDHIITIWDRPVVEQLNTV